VHDAVQETADAGNATAVLYGDTVDVATARRCLRDTNKTGKTGGGSGAHRGGLTSMYGSAMFGGDRQHRRGEGDLGGSNLRLLPLQFFSNMVNRGEGTRSLDNRSQTLVSRRGRRGRIEHELRASPAAALNLRAVKRNAEPARSRCFARAIFERPFLEAVNTRGKIRRADAPPPDAATYSAQTRARTQTDRLQDLENRLN
jgi:hypothetical protein